MVIQNFSRNNLKFILNELVLVDLVVSFTHLILILYLNTSLYYIYILVYTIYYIYILYLYTISIYYNLYTSWTGFVSESDNDV